MEVGLFGYSKLVSYTDERMVGNLYICIQKRKNTQIMQNELLLLYIELSQNNSLSHH